MLMYEILHVWFMIVLCGFPILIFGGIVWAVIKEGKEKIERINNRGKDNKGDTGNETGR